MLFSHKREDQTDVLCDAYCCYRKYKMMLKNTSLHISLRIFPKAQSFANYSL